MFYALQGTMCTNIGENLTQFLASLHKTTKSGELFHSPLVAYVRLKTALRSCICREYAGGSVEHTEKSGVLAVFKPHQRGRISSENYGALKFGFRVQRQSRAAMSLPRKPKFLLKMRPPVVIEPALDFLSQSRKPCRTKRRYQPNCARQQAKFFRPI